MLRDGLQSQEVLAVGQHLFQVFAPVRNAADLEVAASEKVVVAVIETYLKGISLLLLALGDHSVEKLVEYVVLKGEVIKAADSELFVGFGVHGGFRCCVVCLLVPLQNFEFLKLVI